MMGAVTEETMAGQATRVGPMSAGTTEEAATTGTPEMEAMAAGCRIWIRLRAKAREALAVPPAPASW
jgi:hypothetical protein